MLHAYLISFKVVAGISVYLIWRNWQLVWFSDFFFLWEWGKFIAWLSEEKFTRHKRVGHWVSRGNKAHALCISVFGNDVREGLPCTSQFKIINAKSPFINVIMHLGICLLPSAFSGLTLLFINCVFFFFTRVAFLHAFLLPETTYILNWGNCINIYVCIYVCMCEMR